MKRRLIFFAVMLRLILNSETLEAAEVASGGQARVRGDFSKNQNLGDFSAQAGRSEEQVVQRSRLNLALKPVPYLEGFAEGQFYSRNGDVDDSNVNLYRAYFKLSNELPIPVSLTAGRQSFNYGSAFFLGENDFYDGLVWDGLKASVSPHEGPSVDLVAARYVSLDTNKSSDEPALYGSYLTYDAPGETNLGAYFFYHKGGFQFFHEDMPDDARWFTLGARLAGHVNERFDYEVEPLTQFGRIDNPDRAGRDRIAAYGGHVEAGVILDWVFKPRAFVGYAFGSGDNDNLDDRYEEFHGTIYNDHFIVGDTSLVPDLSGLDSGDSRASGLHAAVIGFSAELHPRLSVNLDFHHFQAHKTKPEISREIGSEINLVVTAKLLKNVTLAASANQFFTGNFFKDAAGSDDDIRYFYIQTQVEF